MADIQVVSVGVIGPTGPASLSAASVITARGALAVGNAAGTPVALAIGASGRYLRSDGTDPSWATIVAADLPTGIDAAKINTGAVSNTEFNYLDGVTSALQTQLNAKSATSHAHTSEVSRGFYVNSSAISAASPTDNTASTVTYAVALQLDCTLPDGTWTLQAVGGLLVKHSASASVIGRVSINGQDTGGRTITDPNATYWTSLVDDDIASGIVIAGGLPVIPVYIHFRSVSAGTSYAKNPWVFVTARRTA